MEVPSIFTFGRLGTGALNPSPGLLFPENYPALSSTNSAVLNGIIVFLAKLGRKTKKNSNKVEVVCLAMTVGHMILAWVAVYLGRSRSGCGGMKAAKGMMMIRESVILEKDRYTDQFKTFMVRWCAA